MKIVNKNVWWFKDRKKPKSVHVDAVRRALKAVTAVDEWLSEFDSGQEFKFEINCDPDPTRAHKYRIYICVIQIKPTIEYVPANIFEYKIEASNEKSRDFICDYLKEQLYLL